MTVLAWYLCDYIYTREKEKNIGTFYLLWLGAIKTKGFFFLLGSYLFMIMQETDSEAYLKRLLYRTNRMGSFKTGSLLAQWG